MRFLSLLIRHDGCFLPFAFLQQGMAYAPEVQTFYARLIPDSFWQFEGRVANGAGEAHRLYRQDNGQDSGKQFGAMEAAHRLLTTLQVFRPHGRPPFELFARLPGRDRFNGRHSFDGIRQFRRGI